MKTPYYLLILLGPLLSGYANLQPPGDGWKKIMQIRTGNEGTRGSGDTNQDAYSVPEMNGRYLYLAFDENYQPARYGFSISDKVLSFDGEHAELKNIRLETGGQPDFMATLKNNVPEKMRLFQFVADIQGSGEPARLTLVQQKMNDELPRLSVYAVSDGRTVLLISAYDHNQAAALAAAEKKMRGE